MTTLKGLSPKDTYHQLLKVTDGVGADVAQVTDGAGNATPLAVSSTELSLGGVKWPAPPVVGGAALKLNEAGDQLEWCEATKTAELILKANFVGQVTETIGSSRFYPPSDITIRKVYSSISSPGTSSNEYDVKVNGITIFPGSKPSIAANQYRSVDYAVEHPVPSTSYITVDVTRASGSDLVVYIVYN